MKRVFAILAVASGLMTAGVHAQDQAQPQARSQVLQDENLMTPLPKGFKIGATGPTPTGAMTEYIPEAETVGDWSRMVTTMVMHIPPQPDEFSAGLAQSIKGGCPDIEAVKSMDGTENGYAFSLWLFQCPLNPQTGKPEGFVMKAVRGQDALYVVQYAYREMMTTEQTTQAVLYLRQVNVCDTRTAEHPCPAGMPTK